MIKLAFKNICNSMKSHRKIYILLIVSQLFSVISMFFVYGIYGNYTEKMHDLDINKKGILARYDDTDAALVKKCMDEIMPEIGEKLDYVYIGLYEENFNAASYVKYKNGDYAVWYSYAAENELNIGRLLTDEDERESRMTAYSYRAYTDTVGEMVSIGGKEFEIVGVAKEDVNLIMIPFNSCPDDTEVFIMKFFFKNIPTTRDYYTITDSLRENMGDKLVYIDEFDGIPEEKVIAYRTIIVISVIIGIMSALNTCVLFGYILSRRTKLMAVYGIIGATDAKRILINETEVLFISIASVITGYALFRGIFQNILADFYEYTDLIYNVKSYGIMAGIYESCIIVFTLILLNLFNRSRLTVILRRAER